MNLDPYLSPITKSNWKQVKDVNLKPQTIELLVENTAETLEDIRVNKDFLNKTPKV